MAVIGNKNSDEKKSAMNAFLPQPQKLAKGGVGGGGSLTGRPICGPCLALNSPC